MTIQDILWVLAVPATILQIGQILWVHGYVAHYGHVKVSSVAQMLIWGPVLLQSALVFSIVTGYGE